MARGKATCWLTGLSVLLTVTSARAQPATPMQPQSVPMRQPVQPATPEWSVAPRTVNSQPSTANPFQESGFAAGGDTVAVADTNAGYIDSALIRSQLRLRYDAAFNWPQPNRAEFFWPDRDGPRLPERSVDFQDAMLYLEAAYSSQVSVFVEAPFRFLNPEVNDNTAGYADMNFGFKWGLCQTCNSMTTLQVRVYAPTGDADRGLGNDHFTAEPALLFQRKLGEALLLEAEFRDWMPIDGSSFAGNILRYGVGLSYCAYDDSRLRLSPLVEFIGWSVLDGQATYVNPTGVPSVHNAATTIVNAKAGVRVAMQNSDFYLGYGRALTGTTWYEDTIRVEFRIWR